CTASGSALTTRAYCAPVPILTLYSVASPVPHSFPTRRSSDLLWLPGPSAEVVNVQAPLPFAVAVPSCVLPSKIVTVLFASAVPSSEGLKSLLKSPDHLVSLICPAT